MTLAWPVQSKGHPGVGSCPRCMNEGKTHFTFITIYNRECGFFIMIYDMSMAGCALHSQSDSCVGCIFTERWSASIKSLVQISLGQGKVESCNLAQM